MAPIRCRQRRYLRRPGGLLRHDLIFAITALGQFLDYHLPGVQAYSLDVNPEPDLLPGTGIDTGPIYTGFGDLSIPEFLQAATTAEILFAP
jgi:hypothetical protein